MEKQMTSTGEESVPSPANSGGGNVTQPASLVQTRPLSSGGKILTIASPVSVSTGRPSGVGGGTSAGGFVLRGNQLVRLPMAVGGASSGEIVQPSGKSPLKVHLVSASGFVKQRAFGTPSGEDQTGDANAKGQQYQVVVPSGQSSQQVVMVSSAGVTTAKQSRIIPPKPISSDREGPVVYYSGGPVGASATVGETVPILPLQSLNLSGAGTFKKSRSVGIPGARKPCNCTKSQCLKLYCECFANGEFCRNCNCTNCHNNLAYENERSKSIKMCLERNPYAFQPKIGKGRADTDRLHNKGCNCKKSSCLKNYCECYEAKVPCTPRCKCVGCRNTEGDRTHKYRPAVGLQSLANAASFLSSTMSSDFPPRIETPATDVSYEKPDPKRMPWYYMTDDVVEATALCLLAKAEQMEATGTFDEVECQMEILKEFGRCLQQIINSAA